MFTYFGFELNAIHQNGYQNSSSKTNLGTSIICFPCFIIALKNAVKTKSINC